MNLSVSNSPFNEEQAAQLNQVLKDLTPEQRIWLSGYLTAGQQVATQAATTDAAAASPQVAENVLNSDTPTQAKREITVLYGSETGNAQG